MTTKKTERRADSHAANMNISVNRMAKATFVADIRVIFSEKLTFLSVFRIH
jgi:hypothetical protein